MTSQKQAFENFAKFFVNFQDVTSFGKILKELCAYFGKILRKKKFFQIFVNFKENLMKILIGLRNYFAISKRFWVNYKEFPENYSGNLKPTLEKFHRIKKSWWNISEILRKIRYF